MLPSLKRTRSTSPPPPRRTNRMRVHTSEELKLIKQRRQEVQKAKEEAVQQVLESASRTKHEIDRRAESVIANLETLITPDTLPYQVHGLVCEAALLVTEDNQDLEAILQAVDQLNQEADTWSDY